MANEVAEKQTQQDDGTSESEYGAIKIHGKLPRKSWRDGCDREDAPGADFQFPACLGTGIMRDILTASPADELWDDANIQRKMKTMRRGGARKVHQLDKVQARPEFRSLQSRSMPLTTDVGGALLSLAKSPAPP